MNRSRLPSLLAMFAVVLAACGGAAEGGAPAQTAAPREEPAPPEPRTVEEAQRQIAQAVDELEGRSSLSVVNHDAKPKADPSESSDKASDYGGAAPNRCASPCRALASMKRAVEALCRMTGESDAKCVDARKTLSDNVGKTAACKCDG